MANPDPERALAEASVRFNAAVADLADRIRPLLAEHLPAEAGLAE
jgi:hypothetical protein